MNRFWSLPLRIKVTSVYILANLLVFITDIFLLISINNMSTEMDMVYMDNRELNELSVALDEVQDSMTEYLNYKTSDSLEAYYRSYQTFNNLSRELNDTVTDVSFGRMERNIRKMSENYLEITNQTIEAKRGRNVEKYRVRYESATENYNYISNYLKALNQEQFQSNSEHYNEMSIKFRQLERVSLVVMFAVIAGNVIVIITFVSRMMKPLGELASAAEAVADGNLDGKPIEIDSNDEVGVVADAFNKMVISIREYIEKLRMSMEAERTLKEKELSMEAHLKDAQLKYLQAQINPHFLFNTLNAGAQLAMMEGANRTYEYVQTVADFFRYNVKKQDKPVSISEEVKLIDNYIQILNVRFSGDIKYEKDIDESLLGVEMPSMILQPIVENCVNHGIREMEDRGIVSLRVFRQDNEVCISIKDNGKGMSQSTIEKIINGTLTVDRDKTDSNGIGMDNVIARIRMFTDDEDSIRIISEGEGKGTEIVIYLPIEDTES